MAKGAEETSSGTDKRKVATATFLYSTIFVFGFIGASVRYLVGELPLDSWLPLNTLIINLIGCYIISIIYLYLGRRVHLTAQIIKGMGVGLVGAFTTLSAFYVEEIYFLAGGHYDQAVVYFVVSAVTTLLASLLGMRTSDILALARMKRLEHRRIRQHEQRAKLRARQVGSALNRLDRPADEGSAGDAAYPAAAAPVRTDAAAVKADRRDDGEAR